MNSAPSRFRRMSVLSSLTSSNSSGTAPSFDPTHTSASRRATMKVKLAQLKKSAKSLLKPINIRKSRLEPGRVPVVPTPTLQPTKVKETGHVQHTTNVLAVTSFLEVTLSAPSRELPHVEHPPMMHNQQEDVPADIIIVTPETEFTSPPECIPSTFDLEDALKHIADFALTFPVPPSGGSPYFFGLVVYLKCVMFVLATVGICVATLPRACLSHASRLGKGWERKEDQKSIGEH